MRYLVSGKQAAEIDRHTIEEIGVPQLVLMERAALAVAEEAAALIADQEHQRILVVAESGNNGGDGVAAARILHQRGYSADVWALGGLRKQSDAYKKQVELAEKAGVPFVYLFPEAGTGADLLQGYSVIVDAIFGVGLTREVAGVQKEAVDLINRVRESSGDVTVVAVDIPSGISSETGEVLGTAVRADRTVTFGFEKIGMRFAKDYTGTVTIPEIGFYLPEELASSESLFVTYDRVDIRRLLPVRSVDGNKGSFGRVMVVAGSEDMCGAAFLAAEAAYRTGCGLVKVVTHENNRAALQQLLPEAILKTYGDPARTEGDEGAPVTDKEISWADVIILGPGLGQSETALLLTEQILREARCPLIVDADAINLLAEHTEILKDTAGSRPLVLTPHMLEMTRLLEKTLRPDREAVGRLKKDRIAITRRLAGEYGATIVLKDAGTFVTEGVTLGAEDLKEQTMESEAAEEQAREPETAEVLGGYINSSGNDAMAKGGSGDVLTGVIAGLIAQGLPAPQAARLGVYIHGLAGDKAREKLGAYGVIARDLLDALGEVTG